MHKCRLARTTSIEYSLPARSHVVIEIFNLLGQKTRTLVDETKSAGTYSVEWDGTDDSGNAVASGMYLYCFIAGDVVQAKKMLLIK
jgi:flagellar hook assembly protein FlgD